MGDSGVSHCLVVDCEVAVFSASGGWVASVGVWVVCVFDAGVGVASFDESVGVLAAGAAASEEDAGAVDSSSAAFWAPSAGSAGLSPGLYI